MTRVLPRKCLLLFGVFGALAFIPAPTVSGAPQLFLPPIDGTLGGELVPFNQPDLKLDWKVTAQTLPENTRHFAFSLTGRDAVLSAIAKMRPGDPKIEWQVQQGKIQLGTWFAALSSRYFPAASATTVRGALALSGSGTTTKSFSEYTGGLRVELVGAGGDDPAAGWSVSQLLGRIVFIDLPAIRSEPHQRIEFVSATIGQLTLSRGLVDFTIESASRIQVHVLTLEALGGTVTLEPFLLDLAEGRASARVALSGIDLGRLRAYLPAALTDAQGKIDGHVQLNWSAAGGLKFGTGDLRLRPGTPASIRLAPAPGFLSAKVPERYNLLPEGLGALSRAFSAEVPAHAALVAIEMGEEPLVVESLQADLSPAASTNESTASIHLVARPKSTATVKRLRLNVNVSGPLADVVRFGLDGRLSFGQ